MSAPTPATQPAAVAATIRRLRREKGLTQEALAQAVGVSPQAISKWETGQTMPDITLLLPLSKELGIGVNELLGGNRRQELEKKFQDALRLGDEYTLIVTLEALEEFPDDETFLYRRACDELFIGERSSAGRRAFYLNLAIRHFNDLHYRYPDNEIYTSMQARTLRAMGRINEAQKVEKTLTEPAYKAAALEGEDKRRHLQEKIRADMEALCGDLLRYDTPDSLAAYRTIVETMLGEDMAYRNVGWNLHTWKAQHDLNEENIEGFAASMSRAYETAKAYDSLERGIVPCRAPLFDLLTYEIDNHSELHAFISNYALLSHPAAVGLRRRIVKERFVCRLLLKHNWREYFRFCCQHINEEGFFDFSVQWDHDVGQEMYMPRRFPGYAEAEMLDNHRALVEKLVSEGIMTGLVACFGETIFGFCNCGDKDKYFGLGLEEEERAIPTAPEGAKILSIVEILVSRFFQNSGIEEMLLDRALTEAKKKGFTHAEVYPLERMELDKEWFNALLSLYEKMGFTVIRDLSNEQDGRYFIMQKEL